jgi:hypothetical protein
MEGAGALIIIFIFLVAGYSYFNNRGHVPVDEMPVFTSLCPGCPVDIASDTKSDFLVYLTEYNEPVFSPVTGSIRVHERSPVYGDLFEIITSSGSSVCIKFVHLLSDISTSTVVDAGQQIGLTNVNHAMLRVYSNHIPITLKPVPDYLLPLLNINTMDTNNAASQPTDDNVNPAPVDTGNPGDEDQSAKADLQSVVDPLVSAIDFEAEIEALKYYQFTAKAAGANLEFGKMVKAEIAWRIEKGYSSSEQEAIFQMFNFSINYQRNWKFTTSGNPQPVFYNNKKN